MTSVCACVFYSNPSSLLYISLVSVASEQAHSAFFNKLNFCLLSNKDAFKSTQKWEIQHHYILDVLQALMCYSRQILQGIKPPWQLIYSIRAVSLCNLTMQLDLYFLPDQVSISSNLSQCNPSFVISVERVVGRYCPLHSG